MRQLVDSGWRICYFGGVGICLSEDCGKKTVAKGLCNRCYRANWVRNNPQRAKEIDKKSLDKRKAAKPEHLRALGRERARRWRQRHPDKVKKQFAEYMEAHPDKYRAYRKRAHIKYYAANKERVLVKNRWNRAKNVAKYDARCAEYRKSNPSVALRAKHRRRSLEVSAPGSFTVEEWADRLAEYGNVCGCCRLPSDRKLHVDHIVPLSRGGSNWIWNLQPLCYKCNCQKHTKTTFYPPECYSW